MGVKMKYIRVRLNEMIIPCDTMAEAEEKVKQLIEQGHNKDEIYIHCTDEKEKE